MLVSTDAGTTWRPLLERQPVTLVEVTPDGTLYAFVADCGLVRTTEASPEFETLTNDIGGGFLLHLAVDPRTPSRLFAATERGRVLASTDQGRTWATFGGSNSSAYVLGLFHPQKHPSRLSIWRKSADIPTSNRSEFHEPGITRVPVTKPSFRLLPRFLRVLEAIGRRAHSGFPAKQRSFATPDHNPAAVMRAKIEKLQRATCSSASYSFLVSQPPELVLNGVSRCAEFGGDFAEHEALRTHGEQLLYGEGGPRISRHQHAL